MSTNPITGTEQPRPRRTPLLKPLNTIHLTAPLWFACGIAGILNAFVSRSREPLKLLTPGQVRDCMDCDQELARAGGIANVDTSSLDADETTLLLGALKTAIAPSGLTAEFHAGASEGVCCNEGQHIAIYSDRALTSQMDMRLADGSQVRKATAPEPEPTAPLPGDASA